MRKAVEHGEEVDKLCGGEEELCACVCVRVRVRACVCVHACVRLAIQFLALVVCVHLCCALFSQFSSTSNPN